MIPMMLKQCSINRFRNSDKDVINKADMRANNFVCNGPFELDLL